MDRSVSPPFGEMEITIPYVGNTVADMGNAGVTSTDYHATIGGN